MNKILKILSIFFLFTPMLQAQLSFKMVDEKIAQWSVIDYSKKDSLELWAKKLQQYAEKLNYPRAEAHATRLMAMYEDFSNRIPEATEKYLAFQKIAKTYKLSKEELTAASDLVYIYNTTKQYDKSKTLILNVLNNNNFKTIENKPLSVFYNNLGIIYRNENKSDSALWAYQASLKLKEKLKDEQGMANLRINISSLYIHQKNYQKALELTNENLVYLAKNENKTDEWYNLINKAGALEGLKRYKEAAYFLQKALNSAQVMESESLEQQTHEQLSTLYTNTANYKSALDHLTKSNALKDKMLNEETNAKIAELQEAYNANEREQENLLLSTQLESQKNKNLAYLIGLFGLGLIAAVIGIAYFKNQKKNKLISAQNQKLSELNREKNHLISVVSHDLSSPFTAIKLWAQNLVKNNVKELEEAQNMILKTSDFGLQTIKEILTIDKNELQNVQIQKTDISDLIKELLQRFEPIAFSKNITIKTKVLQDTEFLMTDPKLLFRALENLLSNALKFSYSGQTVQLKTFENNGELHFEIKDEGKGISKSEQSQLFNRYNATNTTPTAGENSNGLGLHIVKRIADELGAKVAVESEFGAGATFTFSLKLQE